MSARRNAKPWWTLAVSLAVRLALGGVVTFAGTGCTVSSVRAETIFVSPAGNDAHDGFAPTIGPGQSGPVRTLARAQAIARTLRASAAVPLAIELAGGTYRLERPVLLASADSGAPGLPLRIYGATGARVVMSGGLPIAGWVKGRSGELVAKLNLAAFGGTCPSQLFVNGARRARPRLPKSGTFAIAAPGRPDLPGATKPPHFIARPGDLPAGFEPSPETEIVIIDAWTASRLRVSDYSPNTNTLNLQGEFRGRKSRATFEPGMPYFIENQPAAPLDPGQWQCSSATAELRYRPAPGEDADALSFVAPTLQSLMEIRGTADRPVHDITIENIAFENAGWTLPAAGWAAMQSEIGLPAAIQTENCRSITFRSIRLAHIGAQGIAIGKGCENVEVADSQLTDLGGGGIQIGSAQRKPVRGSDWEGGVSSRAPTSNIRVLRNTLRSLGRVHLAGTGIWVGQANHVAIIGNGISDLFYSGISVGWIWNDDLSPIHHNLVAENRIENFGQGVLSDMGGIYTLGRQDGTVVRDNMITNGTARAYGGWGLYADRGSTGIAFTGNIVGKTSSDPMFVHEAGFLWISGNYRLGKKSDTLTCPSPAPLARRGALGLTYACSFNDD
jgi:hypothetical protein